MKRLKATKAAVTISLILLSVVGLNGCGRKRELIDMAELERDITEREMIALPIIEDEKIISIEDSADGESEEATQLTALADDLEEAEKIADLYGIELSSYSYGVATYVTDKDVQELINLGQENDYPTLAPDYKNELHTVQ